MIVGAILTQNTNWGNVAKAIANLKHVKVLAPRKLYALSPRRLAQLIRPAGYFNVKTKRLRSFLGYFLDRYGGDTTRMARQQLAQLREELLSVKGIGPETADSILLYALEKPIFVVDAYTHRILQRHFLATEEADYDTVQSTFMDRVAPDVTLYNDFHAQLVAVGKHYCRPKNPRCSACPLNGWNWEQSVAGGITPAR